MKFDEILIALSLSAAIAYGAVLTDREASLRRTALKTIAVAALAVLAFMLHQPWLLVAALGLSAVGDAFLAGDAERWLPAGLGAFLLAHVGYIWLFRTYGYGLGVLMVEPWRGAGAAAAVFAGVAMLVWLWRSLGPMMPAVALYAGALGLDGGHSADPAPARLAGHGGRRAVSDLRRPLIRPAVQGLA